MMKIGNTFIIIYSYFIYSCELFLEKFKMKCRNFEKQNKLLLFDVLDYIVDQGNMNIWISVSNKKFLSFILDVLKTQNDAEIQTKLLQLIQNWGNSFQNKKDVIPNFSKIYNKFKVNGVVFPPKEQANYYSYITNTSSSNYNNYGNEEYSKDDKDEEQNNDNDFDDNNDFEYIESIKNKLKVQNFENKYRRLVAFLVNMHNNIKSANIHIDKKELSKLKEPINVIRKGNNTLIDTISSGRLKDEKLMDITLATMEDINQTLAREEELKKGNRPNKFNSYFILNEIIPIKNKSRIRAKSERKKGNLNKRINYDKINKNENIEKNKNINNIDDIFDLFSTNKNTNSNNNIPNNNAQNNNIISNYFTNQNTNTNFFDLNQNDDIQNNHNNNDFNNYNINNENPMNQNNNINFPQNRNFNQNNSNNNYNKNSNKNKMIDLFQNNQNNNLQQNNQNLFPNNNTNNINKSNEFDMYGPPPEINSNELANYIGPFNSPNQNNFNNNNFNNNNNNFNNNNNNNQFQNFNINQGNDSNNNNFGMNPNNGNNMEFNKQMTQEEIEREQRLKELDELF